MLACMCMHTALNPGLGLSWHLSFPGLATCIMDSHFNWRETGSEMLRTPRGPHS